jgi:putative oxidoreductase
MLVASSTGNRSTLNDAIDLRTAAYAGLALRLALGAIMIAHALMKVFVFTMPGTAAFFASKGFPGWSAYPVTVMELVGGLLLVTGLGARWAAAALVPVMLGALLVHLPNGWAFTAAGGGWEYVAFLIVALVAQTLLGNGAFALRLPTPARGPTGAVAGSTTFTGGVAVR